MVTLEQVGIIPNDKTVYLVTGPSVDREVMLLKGAISGNGLDPSTLAYDAVFNQSWGMVGTDHSIVVRDRSSDAWIRLGEDDLDNASAWLLNVIATEVVRTVKSVRGGGDTANVQ